MSAVLIKAYESLPGYDIDEIFRYLRADKNDESTSSLVSECIAECENVFSPFVCCTVSDIEISGNTVNFEAFSVESADLTRNLSGCERAVIFAATVGMGIDRLISRYSLLSPAKAMAFQAIGTERIEALCDCFNADVSRRFSQEGLTLRPRFSPGYGDAPLSSQKDIFALLGCQSKIGLSLNDSLIMSPSKSVTAFIGIYRK